MAVANLVSLEDYLARDFTIPTEYLDGILLEKNRPTWQHGALQAWIAALIMRAFPNFVAAPEVHSRLNPAEFRLPDIAVQFRNMVPMAGYAEQPLYLAIEILSPDDRFGATLAKIERYHDWGVPYCWLIDPERRHAWAYHNGQEPAQVDGILQAGEISIDVTSIFSILNP